MAESVVLVADERKGSGSRDARRARKSGKTPAVVYGHNEATEHVTVCTDTLVKAIRHGARLIDLDQKGKQQKALIKDIQWDALGSEILHADFARVSADERVEIEVRVELKGTPVGIAKGGVLSLQLHNLTVECPVISMPDSIRVNVATLDVGQAIHVKELQLPEGAVCLNDEDAIVVQVVEKQEEAEAGQAAGESAEPEVIGRQKGEKEEEGE